MEISLGNMAIVNVAGFALATVVDLSTGCYYRRENINESEAKLKQLGYALAGLGMAGVFMTQVLYSQYGLNDLIAMSAAASIAGVISGLAKIAFANLAAGRQVHGL